MKVIIIVCFAFAFMQAVQAKLTSSSEEKNDFEPEEEECIVELKLDRAEIKVLNSNDVVPENNTKFNEFVACYWHKQGWQDDNGEIYYDKVTVTLKRLIKDELKNEDPIVRRVVLQMISNSVDQCRNHPPPKGNTLGETAVRVQNCIMRKLNEIIAD